MIEWQPIKKYLGARINSISYEEAMAIDADQWSDLLYQNNVIIIDDIELTRKQFYNFSHKFGRPWSRYIHELHGESIEEDMVVNWSDKTGLKKVCIPWHTDNSWHVKWRNPIRILYAVNIPDPNSGCLSYLDLSHVYNHVLNDVERSEIESWQVLIQDYKDHSQRTWYPLVQKNPVTGVKSILISALDLDSPVFGFTKAPGYQMGNTFLLKIKDQDGVEKPLTYLIKYAQRCMEIEGCWFEQKWKPKMLQIISNLNMIHCRTALSEIEDERLIWRKTIAHSYQSE